MKAPALSRRHSKPTVDSAVKPLLDSARKRNKGADTTLIELAFLGGRARLPGRDIVSLVRYDG